MTTPDGIDEASVRDPGPLVSSLDSWRGAAAGLTFDDGDLDLLDLVLSVAPDLRGVAQLGKLARRHGLEYPVPSAQEVAAVLRDERVEVGEFVVGADDALAALGPELFPLAHEGELLSAIHLALQRCRAETTQRWQRAVVERGSQPPPG